jgi:hypothetical protein
MHRYLDPAEDEHTTLRAQVLHVRCGMSCKQRQALPCCLQPSSYKRWRVVIVFVSTWLRLFVYAHERVCTHKLYAVVLDVLLKCKIPAVEGHTVLMPTMMRTASFMNVNTTHNSHCRRQLSCSRVID